MVSSLNSLTGDMDGDAVGIAGRVIALTNGNYVVGSPNWHAQIGAATLGNGATGTTGTVDATNSLVGNITGDEVGLYLTALTNGNYVISSPFWSNGASYAAGASTWASGTTGIVGTVDSTNSLLGSNTFDEIGQLSAVALTNGNYVVASPNWNDIHGAVTWGNGTGGTHGTVDATNSLVGSAAGDYVGSGGAVGGKGVIALTNGNYVIGTPTFNNNSGAVTWGNGTGGTVGTISAANSLVGDQQGEQVGLNIVALNNGNYVISTPFWNNGTLTAAGAVTFANGTHAITGVISSMNSLVGSHAFDEVGLNVIALTNGNYATSSYNWNNGTGAVTWGDGVNGTTGTVSTANSFTGLTTSDAVGENLVALSNGNYVISSPFANNNAGAATLADGTMLFTGNITAANSLVGSAAGDEVGAGVYALTDGNYVVTSPNWNGGTGAATLQSGFGSTMTTGANTQLVNGGTITAANSLVGSTTSDLVGSNGVTALANGNYLVLTAGVNGNEGAATLQYGGGQLMFGGTGTTFTGNGGTISNQNSVLGTTVQAQSLPGAALNVTAVEDTANHSFVVAFPTANNSGRVVIGYEADPLTGVLDYVGGHPLAGTGNVSVDAQAIAGVLIGTTNVVLQGSNDVTVVNNATFGTGLVALPANATKPTLTLDAGRSVAIDGSINTSSASVNIIANDTAANGVIDSERLAGAGAITMASGTAINAGTGNVSYDLRTGTGITNAAAGNVTLNTISAANILGVDENKGTLTLNGQLTSTAAGDSLILSTGVFINAAGVTALNASAGNYLIYSTSPFTNSDGGIVDTNHHYFGINYAQLPPQLQFG